VVARGGGGAGAPGSPDHWLERGTPTRQTSLIVDPPNGRLPPQRPDAEQRRQAMRGGRGPTGEWRGEAATPDDLNIYYRCITRGVLGSVIPVIYGNTNEIVQAPGYVVFRNEMIHESRVIPLDGRPHVSPSIRLYMGDSRGRWDGNTLVVETTNFTDKTRFRGASEQLKVTERFNRAADGTLLYRFTVEDPLTWARPWTGEYSWAAAKSDDHLYEYACHEGNYAFEGIMKGERLLDDERAATQLRQ
jgi:hypothetical protein